MSQDKGLVSSLDRNSEGPSESSALASSTDTSGHPDKVPVLAQRGRTTSKQEASLPTENVLPVHGILVQNPTVQL